MAESAVRKVSWGPNELIRFLGATYFFGGLAGLVPALGSDGLDARAIMMLGVLVLTGAPMVFWRAGLVVDEGARTLTSWWGLLVPFSRVVHPLDAITHVRLLKKVTPTSKGAHVTYPVVLARPGVVGEAPLGESFSYARSRLHAEKLARLLRLDLHDESSGEPVVREHQHLDETLAARHRRLGLPAPYRDPPPGAVARVAARGAGEPLVIEIPSTGFRMVYVGAVLVMLAVILCLPAAAGVAQMIEPGRYPGLAIFFVILISPALVVGLLIVSYLSTAHEIITVSQAGIEVEARGWLQRKRVRVDTGHIEEIVSAADLRKSSGSSMAGAIAHSAGARAVLVRTDKGVIGVGRWVSQAEQEWLRDALVYGLVSGGADAGASGGGVRDARAGSSYRLGWWYTGVLTLVILGLLAYQFRAREQPQAVPPRPGLSGYDFVPGPGSGYIQIHARGLDAAPAGRDARVALKEVRLDATNAGERTSFSDIALSVHRRVDGKWHLVGSTTRAEVRATLEPRGSYTYAAPQEFVIAGAAETCVREPCHFRVHVLGRVGDGRPGWDVTEMAPLPLR